MGATPGASVYTREILYLSHVGDGRWPGASLPPWGPGRKPGASSYTRKCLVSSTSSTACITSQSSYLLSTIFVSLGQKPDACFLRMEAPLYLNV